MKKVHCFPTASAAARKPAAFFQLCGSPIRTDVQLTYEDGDESRAPTAPVTPPIGSVPRPLTQVAAAQSPLNRARDQDDDEEQKGAAAAPAVVTNAEEEKNDDDAPADAVTERVSPLSLAKAKQAGIPCFMAPPYESKTDQPCAADVGGAHAPSLVSIALDELQLGRTIGEGAFGRVFLARWKGKPVAVKVLIRQNLSEDVVHEFETEAKIMSYLHHPNICVLLGACFEPTQRALVFELLKRGCLWDVLRAYRRELPVARRCQMVLDTARGMHYLHSFTRPILHRDMKSPNLLVDEGFSIKISDFGLARVKAQIQTMTGNCGTVQWMAPEVLGNHKYTEKADVFSFGIVVWEIFTGRIPYDGMTQIQAALSVLNRDLRPSIPSSCPKFFARLMKMCWARDPEDRPSFDRIVQLYEQQVRVKDATAAVAKLELSKPSRVWKP